MARLNPDLMKKIRKPQNQISEAVKEKAFAELRDWFMSFEMAGYHAALLSSELIDKAVSERIDRTAASAPDVYLSDSAKVESLVMNARHLADELDQKEELEKLLEKLVMQDSQEPGNSL